MCYWRSFYYHNCKCIYSEGLVSCLKAEAGRECYERATYRRDDGSLYLLPRDQNGPLFQEEPVYPDCPKHYPPPKYSSHIPDPRDDDDWWVS